MPHTTAAAAAAAMMCAAPNAWHVLGCPTQLRKHAEACAAVACSWARAGVQQLIRVQVKQPGHTISTCHFQCTGHGICCARQTRQGDRNNSHRESSGNRGQCVRCLALRTRQALRVCVVGGWGGKKGRPVHGKRVGGGVLGPMWPMWWRVERCGSGGCQIGGGWGTAALGLSGVKARKGRAMRGCQMESDQVFAIDRGGP